MGNHEELEQLWRYRLDNAKLRLDFARNYLNETQRDRPGSSEHADAIRAESVAHANYLRVLRAFTDLIVERKVPDEVEWHKAAAGE